VRSVPPPTSTLVSLISETEPEIFPIPTPTNTDSEVSAVSADPRISYSTVSSGGFATNLTFAEDS